MHPFKAFISMYAHLSDEDWSKIQPCLSSRMVQENRIILKPGCVCENLYFLANGSVRYFCLNDGKDITTFEIQPPNMFTLPQSFTRQEPSKEGIQALEESLLWVISREDAYKLLKVPQWNNFISKL